ncbi:hypothetical protein [Ramlibacter sp.]|uniref:hypothetical protein n=1 Tax=Ramlibacter sp. TaxID=1917967 RepID=UPI00261E6851|nr:hypothetical protein [Ramlibacter sp.]
MSNTLLLPPRPAFQAAANSVASYEACSTCDAKRCQFGWRNLHVRHRQRGTISLRDELRRIMGVGDFGVPLQPDAQRLRKPSTFSGELRCSRASMRARPACVQSA